MARLRFHQVGRNSLRDSVIDRLWSGDCLWQRVVFPFVVCVCFSGSSFSVIFAADDFVVDKANSLILVRSDFEFADGPCWDGNGLVVADVKGDRIYRYQPRSGQWKVLVENSGRVSATFYNHGRVYLCDNGEKAFACVEGIHKRSLKNFEDTDVDAGSGEKPFRPNDLVIDSEGGAYVTMTARGEVIYVGSKGDVRVAVKGIETPNGIALSPDGRTLYVASFIPKEIWAYDISTSGQTTNGRLLARMTEGPDRGADGMTVDRAGNLYCAGPDAIWIWNPLGELIEKISCPSKPINCTFGDPDMRSLYITCIDGLYMQRMRVSGCSARPASLKLNPPLRANPNQSVGTPSSVVPDSIQAEWNVVVSKVGHRKLLADFFSPTPDPAHRARPALVVVHGGGWHSGDKTKFQPLSIRLAQRGYVVASVEYRLAEEAPFPAAINDCLAAVRYLRANADRLGVDPEKIGAVGGSAGGHLVGLMASGADNPFLIGDVDGQVPSSRLQAAIVMAGPMQMLSGSVAEKSRNNPEQSNANRWLRDTVDDAPALYRQADAYEQINSDTCPILFLVGEFDLPARNEPSRKKLEKLGISTGVRVFADGKHGCWNRLPWIDQMVDQMDSFFRANL